MNSRGAAPAGQTARERVELRRAEAITAGCTSDPADDRDGTLGVESAIIWSKRCTSSYREVLLTIRSGSGYALAVQVPVGSEASAAALLDQLASSFEVVAPHIIHATETQTFDNLVYDFRLRGDVLTMDVISDTEPADLAPQTGLYQTLHSSRVSEIPREDRDSGRDEAGHAGTVPGCGHIAGRSGRERPADERKPDDPTS